MDDIFAFIIVMPTLRRIACFRDDIIFVIYMYQRWIYDVDETRTASGYKRGAKKGQIKVGMWADLILLSEDIFAVEPEVIEDVSVRMTICNGRIVFGE